MSQGKLGKRAGYSQQRVGSIEDGQVARPEKLATQFAEALQTTREWLLWKEGRRSIGPSYLPPAKLVEKYERASLELRAEISRLLEQERAEQDKSG